MRQLTRRSFLAGAGSSLLLINGMPVGASTPVATPESGDSPWWQGALFYEMFVRSFYDSDGDGIGDFNGVLEKLDFLRSGENSLGIDALWLMPIMPSPSYHGYDVTDYYSVNPEYGTIEEFQELVEALHARDMRVIIDYPVNHTSVEHPWFIDAASSMDSQYRDWYIFSEDDPGYIGPWGQQVWHKNPHGDGYYYGIFDSSMPDLNYHNVEVNEEVQRITHFWLTEMNVDGFRMDAVKHMIEQGTVQEGTPETIQWIRDFSAYVKSVKPDAFTVGEVMAAGTDSLLPYYPDTLDTYFHFQMAREMVTAANFGNGRKLPNFVTRAQEEFPGHRWSTFLTNHDEQRIGSELKGDMEKLRVAAMLLLSLPGTAFLYYGEEIGMPGTKPDPNIRTPMQWSGDAGGGFTTGTPYTPMQEGWESLNVAAQEEDPDSLLATYRAWGQLRSKLESLRTGEFVSLETSNRSLIAFLRTLPTETAIVAINLGGEDAEAEDIAVTLPDGDTVSALTGDAGPEISGGTFSLPPLGARSGDVWLVS